MTAIRLISAGRILEVLGPDHTRELLAAMSPRQAAAVLQHIPEDQRESALAALPVSTARQLKDVLSYPRETAGGMFWPILA